MKFTKKIGLLFLFTFVLNAQAIEKNLCTVTSDIDSDYAQINYEMDQDSHSITHLYQDSYHAGKLLERIELNAEELKDGIVLNRKDKYIIVRMHSDNYDSGLGGVLYLDTLYNGVTGQRREYDMELAIDPNSALLSRNKTGFKNVKFIAKRSRTLGVVGIERAEFSND